MTADQPVIHLKVTPTIPDDYAVAISRRVAIATADVHLRIAADLILDALDPKDAERASVHLDGVFAALHPEPNE